MGKERIVLFTQGLLYDKELQARICDFTRRRNIRPHTIIDYTKIDSQCFALLGRTSDIQKATGAQYVNAYTTELLIFDSVTIVLAAELSEASQVRLLFAPGEQIVLAGNHNIQRQLGLRNVMHEIALPWNILQYGLKPFARRKISVMILHGAEFEIRSKILT